MCETPKCAAPKVLRGTRRAFEIDATSNARANGEILPGSIEALSLESDAPTSVEVFEYSRHRDACDNAWLEGHLRFLQEGTGTVRLRTFDRERARFTFEVVDAAGIDLSVFAIERDDSWIDGEDQRGPLSAQVGDLVLLNVAVLDQDFDELWPDGLLEFSVGDGTRAAFAAPTDLIDKPGVRLLSPGTTQLRVRVADVEATLDLRITTAPGSDGGDTDAGTE